MATPPNTITEPDPPAPEDTPQVITADSNAPPTDNPNPPTPVELKAPTTIGTYVFVGMLYFVILIAIINLPYINGMMYGVYFFLLFLMIVVMYPLDQFIRTAIMTQLTISYFLLLLFKTAEGKGDGIRIYNVDTLIRTVIVITFIGIIPFILPHTVDFVKYITTREIG